MDEYTAMFPVGAEIPDACARDERYLRDLNRDHIIRGVLGDRDHYYAPCAIPPP